MPSYSSPDNEEYLNNGLLQAHLMASRGDLEGARTLLNTLREQYPESADVEDEIRKLNDVDSERIPFGKRLVMCLPEGHKLLKFGIVALVFGLYELYSVWPDFRLAGIDGTTVMHSGKSGIGYTVPLRPYFEFGVGLITTGAISLLLSLIADKDEVSVD